MPKQPKKRRGKSSVIDIMIRWIALDETLAMPGGLDIDKFAADFDVKRETIIRDLTALGKIWQRPVIVKNKDGEVIAIKYKNREPLFTPAMKMRVAGK